MRLKHIDDVNECPHCDSDVGYYQKVFVKGWVCDNKLFEKDPYTGERPAYNIGMYDYLTWGNNSPTCYCIQCDKAIGTIKGQGGKSNEKIR
jgi:hypothetical protein